MQSVIREIAKNKSNFNAKAQRTWEKNPPRLDLRRQDNL